MSKLPSIEETLQNFLAQLNKKVFVKSTDSISGEVEELNPEIIDMEEIIKIDGEWDRTDLKEILTQDRHAIGEMLLECVKATDWRNAELGNTPYDSDIIDYYEKALTDLQTFIKSELMKDV